MKNITDDERKAQLEALGLNPDGAALTAVTPDPNEPAKPKETLVLAPPHVDPHTMPVDDIVLDVRLLDRFTSLDGREPADYLFALYKSPVKGDRNKVLWAKVTRFIAAARLERKTGGMVKEYVKTTKEERDVAKLIAGTGVTTEDLAEALRLLAEKREGNN